jgi:single-stranded-DNA-specific exonuclease
MKRRFLSLLLLSNAPLFCMEQDLAARLSAVRKRSYAETQSQPSSTQEQRSSQYNKVIKGSRGTYIVPAFDEQTVNHIMEQFHVSKPVAQTLYHRGLKDDDAIKNFLNPPYDAQARHPSLLKDANKAIERISLAIERGEKIRIVGDYDVDGMTSTTLLISCLRPLNANIDYHCPNRMKDGYGIRAKHIEKAKEDGCTLVITVDNGISAFEAGKKATELGIDLLITDHHQEHDSLPEAYAIVNPNQKQCTYPCKALAGVGVAFKLMQLLYGQRNLELPKKAYELMMIGTIADVVPLVDENRYWVRKGFEQANSWRSPAFQQLIDNANIESPTIGSTDIAFGIAPQLNAIGRLDDANLGIRFLLDQDDDHNRKIIGTFIMELNNARKALQAEMFDSLNNMVYKQKTLSIQYDPVFIASHKNWHVGINGLVASKAVEKWHKPTILLTETTAEDGTIILKGSGRSIAKYHLFEGLQACKDLLKTYGGHPAAAGLCIEKSKLDAFKARLRQHFIENVQPQDRQNKPEVDGLATFNDLTPAVAEDIKLLEPFGNSNPAPCLYFGRVRNPEDKKPAFLGRGKSHVRATLEQQDEEKDVNFFFRPDAFYALPEKNGAMFDLVGNVNDNWWSGKRSITINAIDFEKGNSSSTQTSE